MFSSCRHQPLLVVVSGELFEGGEVFVLNFHRRLSRLLTVLHTADTPNDVQARRLNFYPRRIAYCGAMVAAVEFIAMKKGLGAVCGDPQTEPRLSAMTNVPIQCFGMVVIQNLLLTSRTFCSQNESIS